jgi:hypothetical protein
MYVKLFQQILDSSIAEDRRLRHFFTDLLLCADSKGLVMKTEEAIARATRASLEEVRWGLAELEKPDPRSKSPEMGGRRIIRVEGCGYGWQIVNYEFYRGLRDAEQLRESTRERVRRCRANKKAGNVTETKGNTSNAITEAEAEAEVSRKGTSSHPSPRSGEVEDVVAYYVSKRPTRRPGTKERARILARLKEGIPVAHLKEAIDGCLANPFVNDAGKVFDGLELICRDSAKVEQYRSRPLTREVAYGQGVSDGDIGRVVPYNPRS